MVAICEDDGEDWDDKPVCQTILWAQWGIFVKGIFLLTQNDMPIWLMSEASGYACVHSHPHHSRTLPMPHAHRYST
jgi:hypothetical protein